MMCSTTLNQSNPGMISSPMTDYFKPSKGFYLEQINYMYKEQLYSNVLVFGSITLSMSEKLKDVLSEPQQVHVLILCGDSAYFTQDYVRAESYYRKALQLYKSLAKSLPNLKETLPEDSSNDIKYKLYLCYMQWKKPQDALSMLQSIPAKSRTVRTNMALGKLYMQNGMERPAITSFKEVLKECPTSMEAIEALISLGLKESDLQSFFNHRVNKMPYSEWFFTWIKAQQALSSRDFAQAIDMLNMISENPLFQNNHYFLESLANAYTLNGDYDAALGPLQLSQRQEPANMNGMDLLAFLLWWGRKTTDLERLMQRLGEMNYSENRPEAWIALAYFSHLTGRSVKGAQFAQRALTCSNNKNVEAMICKGYLLSENKKLQEAAECFREATQLCGNRFEPHEGLVNCYLELQRYRDASTIANCAMKKLGQTPRVLTMCALPLSKDPLTFSKAKSYLEKALQIDKTFMPAVFLFVDILEEEAHFDTAIHLLMQAAENSSANTQVHLRLAQLWTKANSDDRAADHFSLALRLDPTSRDAREGLNRLDPSSNRNAVHESGQATSYDLGDDVDLDEDEDDHDLEAVDSELDPSSLWSPQADF